MICIDCGEVTSEQARKSNKVSSMRCEKCQEKYFAKITDNVSEFADKVIQEA